MSVKSKPTASTGPTGARPATRGVPRAAPVGAALAAAALVGGCLNTQSVAFEEQPAELASPEAACRSAAEADDYTVIDITDLREVSEGYWEARFVVQDPELRNLLGCRHNTREGFTEVVRLDE